FEARLKAFLEGKSINFEGKDYDVKKIDAYAARVFSANCVAWEKWATATGVVHEKQADGSWVPDQARTKSNKLGLGISRPWGPFSHQVRNGENHWGFCRWYDNAGGGDFNATSGVDPKLSSKGAEPDDAVPDPIDYAGGHDITN